MSAVIIPMPGASCVPIVTSKLPRGRPQKNVVSIRRAKQNRVIRKSLADSADALEAKACALREKAIGFAQGYIDGHFKEAASLEAQARAIRAQVS